MITGAPVDNNYEANLTWSKTCRTLFVIMLFIFWETNNQYQKFCYSSPIEGKIEQNTFGTNGFFLEMSK